MNLTSLGVLKAWLKSTTTDDDVLLTRLIAQISTAVLNDLQRPSLTRTTYTEIRSGHAGSHNQSILLRNWPVVSITSLTIDGQTIPAAASMTSSGYTLEPWDGTSSGVPQQLSLRGYRFACGANNIQIVYQAGYALLDQPYTVMSNTPYVINFTPALGAWAQDDGVTYANGTPLTAVKSAPSQGQYTVTPDEFGSVTYAFNSADAAASVLISYSFTPAALEQATMEWIAERYRYKDRIGQTSKSLGGTETSAYSLKGMPDYVDVILNGYRKFLPL